MSEQQEQKIDLRAILDEYRYEDMIFSQHDDRIQRIKQIINKELTDADRIIFLVYTETQSYRALGKLLGVSHTTAGSEVRRIRKLITDKL